MTFTDPRWLLALAPVPVLLLLEWRAVMRARRALGRLVGERASHPLLEQRPKALCQGFTVTRQSRIEIAAPLMLGLVRKRAISQKQIPWKMIERPAARFHQLMLREIDSLEITGFRAAAAAVGNRAPQSALL